jgi:threonine dehydrogenase-like Zn-dependent dehydrogenase
MYHETPVQIVSALRSIIQLLSMRAIRIIGTAKTDFVTMAKPELKPGHVLLKIGYVGFCGSDLNTFRGLNPLVKLPIIPGHEIGAVVEAVGRPETYLASVSEVAFTGRIVYVGYAKEKVPFDTQYFIKKEVDILGSRNAMPCDFRAVMEYMKKGTCPVDKLVTAVYPPEEAQIALEKWAANPSDVFRILIHF